MTIYLPEQKYRKLKGSIKEFYQPLSYKIQFLMEILDSKDNSLESELVKNPKLN